jgi:NADH-quinone oxidoreductase subunit M
VLSSAGLPGLNGFIGEFTIMQGAYISPDLGWRFLLFAVIGVILAAVYLLRMFGGAFMGELRNPENRHLQDLDQREVISLVLFIIPIVIIGVYPNVIFGQMQPSIAQLLESMSQTVARF